MKKYIALLRGVNVGGKNKISMSDLKIKLIENGFHDVTTYINSGNIIFSSDCENSLDVKIKCESIIFEEFKIKITIAILTDNEYRDALSNAPKWWGEDQNSKHNAIFVISPMKADEVIKQVGEIKPEYEKSANHGQVIFWSAPLKTFSHTRWANIVATSLYSFITIRNANTAKKIASLL